MSNPLPPKDPKRITPDMVKNEDCPCPTDAVLTYECVYKGYCALCVEFHQHETFPYCSLPPGKDQYLVPWGGKGTALRDTYAAIEPPPKDAGKKADCPCEIHCVYNGYCEQCGSHSEKYHACAPPCK